MRRRSNGFCFELFSVEKLKFFVIAMLALLCVACGGAPVAEDQNDVTVLLDTPTEIKLEASNAPTSWVVDIPAHGDLSGEAPDLLYSPEIGYVGPDSFTFTATNGKGTSTPATVSINVVSDIVEDAVIESFSASSLGVIEGSSVTLEWTTLNADTVEITPGIGQVDLSGTIDVTPSNTITYTLVAQNSANTAEQSLSITVYPSDPELPQDPGEIAPEIAVNTSDFSDAVDFLFTGGNPIQTGVVDDAIKDDRVSVIRGRVRKKNNEPLSGVTISIVGNTKYGITKTRADGVFDMALNGGASYVVQYTKPGYISSQRKVDARLHDYSWADDVVLVAYDGSDNAITFGSNSMQVAQGSVVNDSSGERQVTILLPSNVTANHVTKNGVNPLDSVTLRATEFTVGDNGLDSMPGDLPSSSAYTYAAEFSIDEAITGPGESIVFSQPLPIYLDNFIGIPTGGAVPAGWYDSERSAWIASENGRVIEILTIENGKASVDLVGEGVAATPQELIQAGITDEELVMLPTLYTEGKSLWRIPISHFTPWDFNFPYWAPDGVRQQFAPIGDGRIDDPCEASGSIIECQNQVLGERIPLVGTGLALNYRSDRAFGYSAGRTIKIPLTDDTVPEYLQSIEVVYEIAGRQFSKSYTPAPNLTFEHIWDGLDGYGRELHGSVDYRVVIGFEYPLFYSIVPIDSTDTNLFGAPSGAGSSADPVAMAALERSFTVTTPWSGVLKSNRLKHSAGLGGWNLDQHHTYDPESGALYYGDGRKRITGSLEDSNALVKSVITMLAGTGEVYPDGFDPHGLLASDVPVQAMKLDVGPDGSIYFTDPLSFKVRKIAPDGRVYTIAGNGDEAPANTVINGLNATSVGLEKPWGICVDDFGNVFFTDKTLVRKVTPEGVISTIAGGGIDSESEGILAVNAKIEEMFDVDISSDGSLFVTEVGKLRIRKITPDGYISTIAGNGAPRDLFDDTYHGGPAPGDGGQALDAPIVPAFLAVGGDGSIYFSELYFRRIRKVDSFGVITTIAGNGASTDTPIGIDMVGGVATETPIEISEAVHVDQDGTVYFFAHGQIMSVSKNGYMTRIAGTVKDGSANDSDGVYAREANIGTWSMATNANGELLFADVGVVGIRKLSTIMPGAGFDTYQIPSEDGSVIFDFDGDVRHVSTRHSLTDKILLSFGYSPQGYLTSITDADDNILSIIRSGKTPSEIVTQYSTTTLIPDSDGYIKQVINPNDEIYDLTYDVAGGGLLEVFEDPEHNISTMKYDNLGKLILDENPIGGSWVLDREDKANRYEVTLTSKLGRETMHSVVVDPSGEREKITTQPNGAVSISKLSPEGDSVVVLANGLEITTKKKADPRFGLLAQIQSNMTIETPIGRTMEIVRDRLANYVDVLGLSVLSALTDTYSINGKTTTSVFDVGSRTYTVTSPEERVIQIVIDDSGRIKEKKVTGLHSVFYDYDDKGRFKSVTQGEGPNIRSTVVDYRLSDGFVDRIVNDNGSSWAMFTDYDLSGRPHRGEASDGNVLELDFDALGAVTGITPPGKPKHEFVFNGVGMVSDYIAPEEGAVERNTHYELDRDKKIDWIDLPDGTKLDFGYHPTKGYLELLAWEGLDFNLGYHQFTGQLETIGSPYGVINELGYDGSLLASEDLAGDVSGSVVFEYNNDLLINSIKVNGSGIVYEYDEDGVLILAGGLVLVPDNNNGLLRSTTLDNISTLTTPNMFGETYSYDAKYGGSTLYAFEVSKRDDFGREIDKTETVEGITKNYHYDYDLSHRLWKVSVDGVLVREYGFDDNGNRTHVDGVLLGQYDNQDRLTSYAGNNYQYTDNGELRFKTNVSTNQVTEYVYDAFGNLANVKLPGKDIDYIIDGRSRRVGKKIAGAKVQGFLYADQLNPIAELDGSNNVVSQFVYGDKGNVPSYMVKGGDTYRIISDSRGSVRLVVDADTGAVFQQLDYDEFGNVLNDTNPGFQPFGFAGGIYDNDTKLVRFGVRDYDASIGRWTAKDPILFNGGQTNLYIYVNNDPINSIDPNGLCPWCAGAAIGGIAGGISSFAGGLAAGQRGMDLFITTTIGAGTGAAFGVFNPFAAVSSALARTSLNGALGSVVGQLSAMARDECVEFSSLQVGLSAIPGQQAYLGGPLIALRYRTGNIIHNVVGSSIAAGVQLGMFGVLRGSIQTGIGILANQK
ncbi:hypothetical protein A9Q81_21925 [Gammaproteobacteria bacterium 42_54_T18]|nr:hypothetical protein A9Q81_21925 [Gammaproteobacteria bacterium 42_54_T18]